MNESFNEKHELSKSRKLQSIHLTVEDINERAETVLKNKVEDLRRLATVVSDSNDAIILHDLEGKILAWNRGAIETYGYTETEALGKNVRDIVAETDREAALTLIEKITHGETVKSFELRRVTKDGRILDVWLTTTLLTDEKGKPVAIATTERDITERKRAETVLKNKVEDLRRLATVVSDSNDAIILHDLEGKILAWNRGAIETYGYTETEALRKNVRDIVAETDREAALTLIEKITHGETVKSFELRRVTKDGRILDVWLTTTLLTDEKGKPVAIATTERDITERKKLEEKLIQAQKMEAIGTLAGGIAHDFNNILAAIIGYSELAIEEAPKGSQTRSDLEKILAAGNRAKGVVDQILTFSRKQETKNAPLRISPIVKESLKFLRSMLPSNINVVQNIKSETGYVVSNPSSIHQIIMNLCTNAAHAMKKDNEGTLTVQLDEITLDDDFVFTHPGLTSGRFAQLIVSDTGHGMTKDVQGRIFEPYFTTKSQGEGTGIGLSIIYGIVKSLNGIITVYSEPGKGSVFNVYLPLTDQEQEAMVTKKTPYCSGDGRILFIDDEPDIVEVGTRIIKSLGYDVTAMTSSVDALDFFHENHEQIDLVISDMTMPFIPGDELAREIFEICPDMPIIICTGLSDRLSKEEAMAMGIREYIRKPLMKSEMAEKIHKILAGRSDEDGHEDKE